MSANTFTPGPTPNTVRAAHGNVLIVPDGMRGRIIPDRTAGERPQLPPTGARVRHHRSVRHLAREACPLSLRVWSPARAGAAGLHIQRPGPPLEGPAVLSTVRRRRRGRRAGC